MAEKLGRRNVVSVFETRRLVEVGQVGSLSVADISRGRNALATLSAPAIASLSARWLLHCDAVSRIRQVGLRDVRFILATS